MAKMDSDIVGWITRGGKRIPIRKNEKLKKAYKNKEESDRQKKINKYRRDADRADDALDKAYRMDDDRKSEKAADKAYAAREKAERGLQDEEQKRSKKYSSDKRYQGHRNKPGVKRRAAQKLREEFWD